MISKLLMIFAMVTASGGGWQPVAVGTMDVPIEIIAPADGDVVAIDVFAWYQGEAFARLIDSLPAPEPGATFREYAPLPDEGKCVLQLRARDRCERAGALYTVPGTLWARTVKGQAVVMGKF